MQKQPMEIMSQQLCWETCPTVPQSQRHTTAFSSCNLYLKLSSSLAGDQMNHNTDLLPPGTCSKKAIKTSDF